MLCACDRKSDSRTIDTILHDADCPIFRLRRTEET